MCLAQGHGAQSEDRTPNLSLWNQKQVFQSCWDGATISWVLPVLLGGKCVLLKDTVPRVRIEPPTSRSGIKHPNHQASEPSYSALCENIGEIMIRKHHDNLFIK